MKQFLIDYWYLLGILFPTTVYIIYYIIKRNWCKLFGHNYSIVIDYKNRDQDHFICSRCPNKTFTLECTPKEYQRFKSNIKPINHGK